MDRKEAVAVLARLGEIEVHYERVSLAPLIRFACQRAEQAEYQTLADAIEALFGADMTVPGPGNRLWVERSTGLITPLADEAPAPDPAIWQCKIGEFPRSALPDGADSPLRDAVEAAYKKLTGVDAEFNFSGWGGRLTADERAVVDDV